MGISDDISILPFFVVSGPRLDNWPEDMDARINAAIEYAKTKGLVRGGDTVVIVTGSLAGQGSTNTMQVWKVPGTGGARLRVVGSSADVRCTSVDMSVTSPGLKFQGVNDLRVPL